MRRLLAITILIFLLSFGCLPLFASSAGPGPQSKPHPVRDADTSWDQDIPLSTTADRLDALARLNLRFPGLLSKAVACDADPLDVLVRQNGIASELRHSVSYQTSSRKRKSLLEFAVNGSAQVTIENVNIENSLDVRLVVREVPPVVGIFRGFAGDDCATKRSFFTANLPSERIFFVFDRAGNLKGYIGASHVRSKAGEALYLHTVNGSNINVAETESLIRAISSLRSTLGVSEVLIPSTTRMRTTETFLGSRGAFERLASKRTEMVTYRDAELRMTLEKHSGQEFVEKGAEAVRKLDTTKLRLDHLNISARYSPIPIFSRSKVTVGDRLFLAISLAESGRTLTPTWAVLNKSGGFAPDEAATVVALARNQGGLLTNETYNRIRRIFGSYGLEVDVDLIVRHWPVFIRGHMNSPDAFEPKKSSITPRLVTSALEAGSSRFLDELFDLHGTYVVANRQWSRRISGSDALVALLMNRIDLVYEKSLQATVRGEIERRIRRLSPGLLELYGDLVRTRDAAEFLRRVPQAGATNMYLVRSAVRSTLDRFIGLRPTPAEIRDLGRKLGSEEEIFRLQRKAILKAASATDFARIIAMDVNGIEMSARWRSRLRSLVGPRLQRFFRMAPTVADVNLLRRALVGIKDGPEAKDMDFIILNSMIERVESADEFLALVSFHWPARNEFAGLAKMREMLRGKADFFTRLEPRIDDINKFRLLSHDAVTDIRLMEYSAPKVTRANEFLKMVQLFGSDVNHQPTAYEERLRVFMASHVDIFMALKPSIREINRYRERMFSDEGEEAILKLAFERARVPADWIQLATLFGKEPGRRPSAYDVIITRRLLASLDRFLKANPGLQEIQAYRSRMANPTGDLKLLDHGLARASSADEFLSLVSRRPMVQTEKFIASWTKILVKHSPRFLRFSPSREQVDAFFGRIPRRDEVERLRRSLG